VTHCDRFADDSRLLASPYRVASPVSVEAFLLFLEAINGTEIQATHQNISELSQLCEEFGFTRLSTKLATFRAATCGVSFYEEVMNRLSEVEERVLNHSISIAELSRAQSNLLRAVSDVQAKLSEFQSFGRRLDALEAAQSRAEIRVSEHWGSSQSQIGAVRSFATDCRKELNQLQSTVRSLPIVQLENAVSNLGKDIQTIREKCDAREDQRLVAAKELWSAIDSLSLVSSHLKQSLPVQLFVRVNGTKSISLTAESSDTIEDIKRKIYEKTSVPENRQRLYFQSRPLRSIPSVNGSTIEMFNC
jgi:predicted  nucleic acid-binding Zn-ribbon protein